MKVWMIKCTKTLEDGTVLYWSNDLGWTTKNEAWTFEDSDLDWSPLPVDGEWVLEDAP